MVALSRTQQTEIRTRWLSTIKREEENRQRHLMRNLEAKDNTRKDDRQLQLTKKPETKNNTRKRQRKICEKNEGKHQQAEN